MIQELTDEQLIQLWTQKQKEPLGILFDRYQQMVKGAVCRFAPEISAAERDELTQDIFMAVGESAFRFPVDTKFKPWLYGIVINKTRKWRRTTWVRRRLLKERKGEGVGMALTTCSCPENQTIQRQALSIALGQLSTKQREVFLLYAAEGFKGDEIAAILGISPTTVRTRLYRARELMSNVLAPDSWQAPAKVVGQ